MMLMLMLLMTALYAGFSGYDVGVVDVQHAGGPGLNPQMSIHSSSPDVPHRA